jgi:hypothetical protein
MCVCVCARARVCVCVCVCVTCAGMRMHMVRGQPETYAASYVCVCCLKRMRMPPCACLCFEVHLLIYIHVYIHIYIIHIYIYIYIYIRMFIHNVFIMYIIYNIYIHVYTHTHTYNILYILIGAALHMGRRETYAASYVCVCCLKRVRMLLGGHAGSTRDVCCRIRMRMLPHTYAYVQVPPCVWLEDQLQNTYAASYVCVCDRCRLAYGSKTSYKTRMLPHTYAYATGAALRMARRPATKHVCCLMRMRMRQVPPCVWFEDQLQNTYAASYVCVCDRCRLAYGSKTSYKTRMLPHAYAYATGAALRMVRRPAAKHRPRRCHCAPRYCAGSKAIRTCMRQHTSTSVSLRSTLLCR